MNRIFSTTLLAIALASVTSYAQAENLLQAYQHAKEYDSQLKAQETAFLAVLENKTQVLAGKKPQINLSGSTGYNQRITLHDSTTAGSLAGSYTLGLSKSLFDKNLDARIDQVDASILQAKMQLEDQRQALILRVAQPYFDFLSAIENLRFAETERKAVQTQLNQVKVYFEVGRSPITDLKEAESRYNLTVAQEVSAQQAVIDARESLRVVTGKTYKILNGPGANLPLTVPVPRNIKDWVELAKKNSKTLHTARQAIEVARQNIEVQRSTRKPIVNMYARHTGSFNVSDADLDPVFVGANFGVEANMPISQGGAIDSRIRQAQHEFRQAQQNYTYQERLIESQVRSAYLTIESSISSVKAQEQALISAQTAAEATKTGFEVGTRTAVDVLTTLRDVFSARRDYSSSRYRYLLNILLLRQAAGILSEQNLRQMSTLLTQPGGQNAQGLKKQMSNQQRQQAQRKQQHEARIRAQQQQNEARRRAHQQREQARLRAHALKHGKSVPQQLTQQPPRVDIAAPAAFSAKPVIKKQNTSSDFVFVK